MTNEKKILIADDDKFFTVTLNRILTKEGYDVTVVCDGAAAWNAFKAQEYGVAILDLNMPELSGLEVCRKIKERITDSFTYVIILTASAEVKDLKNCLDQGAHDYVKKPYNVVELMARIRVGLRTHVLETNNRMMIKQLGNLAIRDSLTDLLNHANIIEELDREMFICLGGEKNISVLLIDLDHFKHINDSFGHLAGDEVLKESSKLLKKICYKNGIVGRYGGEEFMVVCPFMDENQSKNLAEMILSGMSSLRVRFKNLTINITCSIGVVTFCEEFSVNEIITWVDDNLYKAKEAGRNCVISSVL